MLRITTWNINSIRLRLDNLRRLVDAARPDVICLQETKVRDELFPALAVAALGYPHQLVHGEAGYNGVAILSRLPLEQPSRASWCGKRDCRHCAALLPGGIELHNLYVPAGGDIPDPALNPKFKHKLDFLAELRAWSAAQRADGRRAVLVGDLNVAPLETDVWSHRQLLGVVSHTPVEVAAFTALQTAGAWHDAVRHVVPPEQKLFTWWSYRNRDWRRSDRGRRLDHVWVTPSLVDRLRAAEVLRDARDWAKPSDHVPVTVAIAP